MFATRRLLRGAALRRAHGWWRRARRRIRSRVGGGSLEPTAISPTRLTRIHRTVTPRPFAGGPDAHVSWLRAAAVTHSEYREALTSRRSAPTAMIAVICVTARPHLLDAALANYARQRHDDRELIVVTNAASFDELETRRQVERLAGARVVRTEPECSLGSCLNLALGMTAARFVAKFDDDDHYGAHYLPDAALAQRTLCAAVVGKHSYFAHLATSGRCILRFPGHEFVESRFLAGGTLLIDRTIVGDVEFPDVSVGEDSAFLSGCWRRGLAVYSADHFNYLQRRGAHNSWQFSDELFSRDAVDIGPGEQLELIDI